MEAMWNIVEQLWLPLSGKVKMHPTHSDNLLPEPLQWEESAGLEDVDAFSFLFFFPPDYLLLLQKGWAVWWDPKVDAVGNGAAHFPEEAFEDLKGRS